MTPFKLLFVESDAVIDPYVAPWLDDVNRLFISLIFLFFCSILHFFDKFHPVFIFFGASFSFLLVSDNFFITLFLLSESFIYLSFFLSSVFISPVCSPNFVTTVNPYIFCSHLAHLLP